MSKLIECPTCQRQISASASVCPGCGEPIRKNKCRSKKGGIISLLAGFLLCILCFASSSSPDGVSVSPGVYLGVILFIAGIVSACICFTSPAK